MSCVERTASFSHSLYYHESLLYFRRSNFGRSSGLCISPVTDRTRVLCWGDLLCVLGWPQLQINVLNCESMVNALFIVDPTQKFLHWKHHKLCRLRHSNLRPCFYLVVSFSYLRPQVGIKLNSMLMPLWYLDLPALDVSVSWRELRMYVGLELELGMTFRHEFGLELVLGDLCRLMSRVFEPDISHSFQAHWNFVRDYGYDCDLQNCRQQLEIIAWDCVAYTATHQNQISLLGCLPRGPRGLIVLTSGYTCWFVCFGNGGMCNT